MGNSPVTLDFSKAQPIAPQSSGVSLDFSKAQPINAQQPTGPTISATPQNDPDSLLSPAAGPFERGAMKIASPFARKMMDVVDKLREVENFTPEGRQEHPIQAHLGDVANKIEGFLFGNEQHPEAGIGTGKQGILTNPVTGSLIPGSSGAPAAAEAIEGGANLVKGGYQAAKEILSSGKAAEATVQAAKPVAEAASSATKPGLISQVMKGEKVAQGPAKAAIRSAVGAEEEAPLLKGHENVADEFLSSIKERERAAYKAQDEAAGFDVKETRAKLKDAEWKVKQPEIDDATRERLTKTISESKQSIADAEKRMSDADVDPKAADNLFKQRKAGEDFRKAIVQHVSADGETVNVDGLLNAAKKLRNTPKGDRLEQFLGGAEKADEFMHKLEAAQDLGETAIQRQKIAKWLAGAAGAGVAGKVLHHLAQ